MRATAKSTALTARKSFLTRMAFLKLKTKKPPGDARREGLKYSSNLPVIAIVSDEDKAQPPAKRP
jgi:hypothetical protein